MTEENTKELKVLDEMGQEVRKITRFEQTVEGLKQMVEASSKIEVTDLKDKAQLELVKRSRIDLRNVEIAIEKRGKGYRDVFNAVNKEIIIKEKELKEITSPEIDRLKTIEAEAKELEIMEARKAKMPARKERLIGIDSTGCYICEDDNLLAMDATAFETYYNNCVANKNERTRIALEEKAEADRKAEQARIDAERAELEAEKEAERKRKEKEAEEQAEADRKAEEDRLKQEKKDQEAEMERRKGLLPERKKALEGIGDNVPMLEDRLMLAMDDNEYTTYYNNRVTAKNEADKKAIEDARLEKEAEKQAEAEAKAEADRKAKEEEDKKKALQKREDYIKFLKDNGYTKETSGDFHTIETDTSFVLYKKVGVFNK
jgi:hypothetical protein